MKILNFHLNSYDALLFELDGTVVDSVEIHDQEWVDTFKDYRATVNFDFLKKTTGIASTRIVRVVNETFKVQLVPNILATEKGKDSTEPYELACKTLGVQMNKCLFLDDGDIDLTGAKLSGMDTILVDIHHPDIFLNATI